jgi:cation diffusion facilitator CzcD-associated flavoprotein CzcO
MSLEQTVRDVLIVGSGLAGLTAAHALRRHGIEAVVLEREADVGASWERRHPQLTLNTHRSVSALPELTYPTGTGAFPKRDAVVAHLRAFRDQHRFEIIHGVEALSARKERGLFVVETNVGVFRARNLVVATGRDAVPSSLPWSGREAFKGQIIHAAELGDVRAYAGRSVLVVGGGNSGFDVLNHLSRVETGPVWLSLRRRPGLLPKRLGGLAVHRFSPLMEMLPTRLVDRLIAWTERIAFGDLSKHGFPKGQLDAATRLVNSHIAIAVDDGAIAAVKQGRTTVVAGVDSFSASGVILSDRTVLKPDIVIAALGYASSLLPMLSSFGVIDSNGQSHRGKGPGETRVQGLWLVGMQPSLTSYFRQTQRESTFVAQTIASAQSR